MGRAKGTMRPKERNEGDGGIGEAGCANGDEKSTMEYEPGGGHWGRMLLARAKGAGLGAALNGH